MAERALLDPKGTLGRAARKHIIFAPGFFNSYVYQTTNTWNFANENGQVCGREDGVYRIPSCSRQLELGGLPDSSVRPNH